MYTSLPATLRTAVIAAVVLVSTASAGIASATTGPWAWTDVSNQVTVRADRPVWTMARVGAYWFYADGHEFSAGGHAWGTDGTNTVDITSDVQSAGLSRIDQIATDGTTAFFLKNTTNAIEAVSQKNTVFTNRTMQIRNVLRTGEGVTSIEGNAGTWGLVTTQNRAILWNEAADRTTNLPDVNDANGLVPLSDGWILTQTGHVGERLRVSRVNAQGVTSEITPLFPRLQYIDFISSNGKKVFLAAADVTGKTRLFTTDGVTVKDVSSAATSLPFWSWKSVRMGWNGASWMILSGKDLVRFDGSSFQNFGKTRDYFVTIASDGNGTFLLGGTASSDKLANGPTMPLRAKLVNVSEEITKPIYVKSDFGGGTTAITANGPELQTAGNHSSFRVGNGGTFVYRAMARDSRGIDHLDIYVNGARVKTCSADTVCDYENTYFTNGQSTRAIPFAAGATNIFGATTDSSARPDVLTIDQSARTATIETKTTNPLATTETMTRGTTNGIAFWTWLAPNQNSLRRDQNATYTIGAWSAKGLRRMDIYVNETVQGACEFTGHEAGNQNCALKMQGSAFVAGSRIGVRTHILAVDGQIAWSPLQLVLVSDANVGLAIAETPATNPNGSTWTWLEPNLSGMDYRASVIFKAQSNTTNGVNRIELFVNGTIRRICDFARAYGVQTCDVTLSGMEFPVGSTAALSAQAKTASGDIVWSQTRSLDIRDNVKDAGMTPASVKTWMSPPMDIIKNGDEVTVYAQAQDKDGVEKIEILADGTSVQECKFTNAYTPKECGAVISPMRFSDRTTVNVMARVTDAKGNITLSDTRFFALWR